MQRHGSDLIKATIAEIETIFEEAMHDLCLRNPDGDDVAFYQAQLFRELGKACERRAEVAQAISMYKTHGLLTCFEALEFEPELPDHWISDGLMTIEEKRKPSEKD